MTRVMTTPNVRGLRSCRISPEASLKVKIAQRKNDLTATADKSTSPNPISKQCSRNRLSCLKST